MVCRLPIACISSGLDSLVNVGPLAQPDQTPSEAPPSEQPPPLTPLTEIAWDTVGSAWESLHSGDRQRREWIGRQRQQSPTSASPLMDSPDAFTETDDVIERVKADQTLDTHEKRLLGCIVDPSTLPTSFQHVHVPVKTVDAIRTMVSLPLLYPKAFNEGVLKSHSMTGALLLGPPGVGKTLLARAVAKESGARMLMVKPSDVMDMVSVVSPTIHPRSILIS